MTPAARDAWLETARQRHVAGRTDRAAPLYRLLLADDPALAEALHLLGTAEMQGGNGLRARSLLLRATRVQPTHDGSWNNLALTLRSLGDLQGALHAFQRSLAFQPAHADNAGNLAVTLRMAGRAGEAERWLRRIAEALPNSPAARNELAANALATPQARRWLRQAIALDPAYPTAHYHLGLSLQTGAPDEAARCYRRTVRLTPDFRDGWMNLGAALCETGERKAGRACYARALALHPDHGGILNNIAHDLRKHNRVTGALAVYDRSIRAEPDLPDSLYNRGLARLLLGDFGGFADYESRWRIKDFPSPRRAYGRPAWDGGPLHGRTLLLHAEQGFGDTLHFVRYIPRLKALGGRVVLEAQKPLLPLLAGLPGLDGLIGWGDPLPSFDCQAPLLSLPFLLGTRLDSVPTGVPYLAPPPDRRPPPALSGPETDGRLRVGLVWAGNPTHRNDRNRSLPRAALTPLLSLPGLRFLSLQMGDARTGEALEDATAGIRDFADSAALVRALDLVITVDTSMAHLAGALGRPVWVLLPFAPDWRWMLGRDDSPWYPTMRLFRQTAPGDWDGVIARVAQALRHRTAGRTEARADTPAHATVDETMKGHEEVDAALTAATDLHRAGRHAAAEAAYRALLARQPRHAATWNNLGILLRGTGRTDEARSCFRWQSLLAPGQPQGRMNLAVALRDAGRMGDADRLYRQALALDPADAQALYNHGNLLLALSRLEEAERHGRRAARLPGARAELHHNWASVLGRLDRIDEALVVRRRSLALDPAHLDSWGQMAKELLERNRVAESLRCSARGLAVQPDHPVLRYNRALTTLLNGDFREGWREYEWRWRNPEFPSRPLRTGRPLWRGEPLDGRTILLHAEQGIGDSLQFLRYLPLVTARAGRVLLAVPDAIAPLVPPAGNLERLRDGQAMPAFDLHCPLLSLPLAFEQGAADTPDSPFLAGQVPYLRDDPARTAAWTDRLGRDGARRVGLVWAGNPKHANDARRSLPAASLGRLVERLGETGAPPRLHSLQVGARAGDLATLGLQGRVRDLAPWLTDYAETAAALAALDLVITVDTSVAHLAGALGRPVWVLLPFAPDWRWMLERDDSPWYPTMRLFRQTAPGDWDGVIARVAQALRGGSGHEPEASPPDPDALRERGDALLQAGRFAEARTLWRRLAALVPEADEPWHRLDVLAFQTGDLPDAVRCAHRSLRLAPVNPTKWTNLGVYERRLGRVGTALSRQQRAVALGPDHPDAMNNLANALGTARAWTAAEAMAARVIRLLPAKADAHYNHAIILKETGRTALSLEGFRTAQRLRPGYVEARFHEALSLLLLGRMEEGWEAYESRWIQPHCKEKRDLPVPLWRGEPLAGRTILVHAEQGFGDSFQFVRYLPLLRAQGARVLALVQPGLEGLVARMGTVDRMIANGERLPPFDLHCPTLSLPLAFGTRVDSVPAEVPYLFPEPRLAAAWKARLDERFPTLGGKRPLRVGLVWAGRPTHGNDANRSLTLNALAPLARAVGAREGGAEAVAWVTLQKGEAARQADHPPAGMAPWNLDAELDSFEDTAAVLAALDLVITVDTSVAHLAGALGRPTWVLLPFHPDWRWMLGRDDSPWYPTMRLFRQPRPGDWGAVIRRVATALAKRVNEAGDRAGGEKA